MLSQTSLVIRDDGVKEYSRMSVRERVFQDNCKRFSTILRACLLCLHRNRAQSGNFLDWFIDFIQKMNRPVLPLCTDCLICLRPSCSISRFGGSLPIKKQDTCCIAKSLNSQGEE